MKKIVVLAALLLAACETDRHGAETGCDLSNPYADTAEVVRSLPVQDETLREKPDYFYARAIRDQTGRDAFAARIEARVKMYQDKSLAPPLRVMMLSTGGPWGAFGSGFLEAEHRNALSADPNPRKFDVVTGASTGSVIAPFVFVGDLADYEKASWVYTTKLRDDAALTKRPLLALLTASALYDTSKMRALMLEIVQTKNANGKDIIERVAEAGTIEHRTLAVAAVNVDSGLTEVFDLTSVAAQGAKTGETPGQLKIRIANEFVDRIMASVAIPIAFEPQFINGCMYQDAGLRQQLFMTGEFIQAIAKYRAPESAVLQTNARFGPQYKIDLNMFRASEKPGLAVQLFMLVNGTANSEPELASRVGEGEVKRGLKPIGFRDLDLLLNQSMWASIDRARLVGGMMGWNMFYQDAHAFDVWWKANRPGQARPTFGGVFGDAAVFDPALMQGLNDYGKSLGSVANIRNRWDKVPGSPDIYSPEVPPAESDQKQ